MRAGPLLAGHERVRPLAELPGPADTPLTRELREGSEPAEKILGRIEQQTPLGRGD